MDQAPRAEMSSEVVGAVALASGGLPSARSLESKAQQVPAAAIAARLVKAVEEAGESGLILIAATEAQAEEVAQAFKAMAPNTQTVLLPPWDCLPYDRVPPSRESMGRRVSALRAMARPVDTARLVVLSPESALQRVMPPEEIAQTFSTLAVAETLDLEALKARLDSCFYVLDERVDEPGEAAFMGQVIDIFPTDSTRPVRIGLDEGNTVTSIRFYHPVTQRTEEEVERVEFAPASELPPLSPDERAALPSKGMEHGLLFTGKPLVSVFTLMTDAPILLADGLDERVENTLDLVAEAREARGEGSDKAGKDGFYLALSDWNTALKGRSSPITLGTVEPLPNFLLEKDPAKAATGFVAAMADENLRVLVAAGSEDGNRLFKALARRLKRKLDAVTDWAGVLAAEPGALMQSAMDLGHGFVDREEKLAVLSALDVYGTRLQRDAEQSLSLFAEPELRINDVVLHEDHGIAVLRALETIETDGRTQDVVRLEYHGEAMLLAPVEEFGRIWRYGAEEEAVTLDRLKGDGWTKRRAEVSAEIEKAAQQLVAIAAGREAEKADKLLPPRGTYARFAARFPYPETPDQTAAIEAVLDDLASGKRMNRLLCGDVGFGKTEVALRAAAVAALNKRQVAVVAPTTVLARQHFETFSRRFEGTDVKVALLSRGASDKEIKETKKAIAEGSVGVVIGTQAIAARDVAFHDLALLVIDEEHRFGVKLKGELRELGPRLHVLSMSATPIPRTLAGAMVGVQEASLLANPPARRRPVRTELAPFDPASVKTALIREKKRGGQSFCVVPRIADIEPIAKDLARLVPDLSVITVHGEMDAGAADDAMMRFANGEVDVLLSTNIIETGLDVPRANTILVWRADRFGMAQLHQLRGRVGRGRAQGSAYFLTEANGEIAPETRSRLSTLLAFDRLGSGLAISARDLDLRGAGDLVGEEQAGHMKLIGVSLYQRLLARAVSEARGEKGELLFEPELKLEMAGAFPADYVSEPILRLNLYSRLQRFSRESEIDGFAEEIEDRFGPAPAETTALLDLARLKLAAREAGAAKISAGPKAIAIEFRQPRKAPWSRLEKLKLGRRNDDRLILAQETEPGPIRLEAARDLVEALGAH